MRPTENARFKILNRISGYKLVINPVTGCWIKGNDINKYATGKFDGHEVKLHIISAILFHELDLETQCSCHKCDIPACCNPWHLYAGNNHENAKDRKYRKQNYIVKGQVINRIQPLYPTNQLEFLPDLKES